jgi:hypothetical protein
VIVGGNVAGRRDQLALLAVVGPLLAAVEEIRDVGVLLGLRDVELAHGALGERTGQGELRALGREGDGIGPPLLVFGHRRVAADGPGELLGDLAHAVGPEVEGDDGVALGIDRRVLPHARRRDELVGLVALVGRADGRGPRVRRVRRLALEQEIDGPLRAVPALVAVHRPVASDDRRHAPDTGVAHSPLHRLEEARARRR